MLDDDKRQPRLYQERYLADGDLQQRWSWTNRRFRWKNIGILIIAFRSKWYKVHICPICRQEEVKTIADSCGGPGLDLLFSISGMGKAVSVYCK